MVQTIDAMRLAAPKPMRPFQKSQKEKCAGEETAM
jgi:hypothetical protein